jgi:hypothetical protein
MKILKPITENEMIATFLTGEINSDRFGGRLAGLLERDGMTREITQNPNVNSDAENTYRRKLFGDFRGYGRNERLFENFPDDVSWYRAEVVAEELKEVLYINWDYWLDVSDHSRRPLDFASKIMNGSINLDIETERIVRLADAIKSGAELPKLILVAKNEHSRLVVLEGHVRITAYMIDSSHIPDPLEVIVGYSENIEKWDLY